MTETGHSVSDYNHAQLHLSKNMLNDKDCY
jgi:hypothetical protein